jgi:hypothetical protein
VTARADRAAEEIAGWRDRAEQMQELAEHRRNRIDLLEGLLRDARPLLNFDGPYRQLQKRIAEALNESPTAVQVGLPGMIEEETE